jgi:hypothetical protein
MEEILGFIYCADLQKRVGFCAVTSYVNMKSYYACYPSEDALRKRTFLEECMV